MTDNNYKIEKINNKKKIDFTDDINLYINQQKNENFFSDKTLLDSIINEIKEK